MRITKFEELAEKAVPWFIIAALVVILATLNGCNEAFEEKYKTHVIKEIEVIKWDDCEYLIYNLGGATSLMTHKGNCKNPIHKCE